MTIIAGFRCRGAWVLGADSQEIISDYSKTTTQKIRVFDMRNGWRVAFAAAGHSGYADMLESHIMRELSKVTDFTINTGTKIVSAQVLELHKKHFWPRPLRERPDTQALILFQGMGGSGSPNCGARLLATLDSSVFPVTDYYAIGVGSHMSDYLQKLYFERTMQVDAAENTAIYILKQIKTCISGCDGETLIAAFLVDGNLRFKTQAEVQEVEQAFHEFHLASKQVFLGVADTRMPERYFDLRLKEFTGAINVSRKKQLEAQAARDKLYQDFLKASEKLTETRQS